MKRNGMLGLSALLLVLILSSGLFHPAMISSSSSSVGNTGFEPWYYYIGGMVNSATGNLFFTAHDISFEARGFGIEVVRAYNSHRNGTSTGFGFGWTFNYHVYLVENGATVSLVEGDGSVHDFTSVGGGRYSPPAGVHSRLIKNGDGSFTLWFKDSSKYNFSSVGRLLNIVDKNDNRLTFSYTDGKLTRVEDDSGLALIVNYNPQNRISSVVDPLSRQIRYEYDASGNLIKVIDAMGYFSLFIYDATHNLKSVVNRFGGLTEFIYSNGKVSEIWKGLYNYSLGLPSISFRTFSIQYGVQKVVILNARGFNTTIEMNDIGNPIRLINALGGVTSMLWNNDMNIIVGTDANGHSHTYEYDLYGNLLNLTDPLGYSTYYKWDIIDTATKYVFLLGNVTNTYGFVTKFGYDGKGNLVRITDATGNSSYRSFDTYGNIIASTDFRDYVTSFYYDSHGYMIGLVDTSGNTTRYDYDGVGRLINITDANLHTTSRVYDANDRVIKVIDPVSGVTEYFYNEEGSLTKMIDALGRQTDLGSNLVGVATNVKDASGNETSFEYDMNGNLIKSTNAMGATTNVGYDALNRITFITDALGNTELYTYDAVGNMLTKTDKNGHITSFEYDALNRLTRKTDALGNKTIYNYDAFGNLVKITDANGYSTIYSYDALSRLTEVVDALGYKTSYRYDANGNLISIVDANNHAIRYVYDELNRLTRIISPIGYETRYFYDGAGNLVKRIDANGNTTIYTYDALNRRTLTSYPDGSIASLEYDAVGNIIKLTNTGGLEDVTHYTYDSLDRLVSMTVNYGGSFNKTIGYTYDEVGNRVSMTDSDGAVTTYQYDLLNRLVRITDPFSQVTTYEYDKAGGRVRTNYPNAVFTTYTYNSVGKLSSLANWHSNGTLISSYSYTYDNVGNRVSVAEANVGITTYQYDPLYRLLNATYPSGNIVEYTYDGVGNRLTQTINKTDITSYTYDSDYRLLSTGSVSYSYEGNGNLIRKVDGSNVTYYEYDFENRLTKVVLPDTSSITYRYSPLGARLSKAKGNDTTIYLYDFEDVLMELDVNGTQKARYIHGPGVDEPISMRRGGTVYYYVFDGLGSVTSLTDINENVVAKYRYDVFGEIIFETGNAVNPYKFIGREYDVESKLYYYRARHYDPKTGRFLQKDPTGYLTELNSYTYVRSNPVNLVDPRGLFWGILLVVAAVVLAVVAVVETVKAIIETSDNANEAAKKKEEMYDAILDPNKSSEEVQRKIEDYKNSVKKTLDSAVKIIENAPGTSLTGPVPTPFTPAEAASDLINEGLKKASEIMEKKKEEERKREEEEKRKEKKDTSLKPTNTGLDVASTKTASTVKEASELYCNRINDIGIDYVNVVSWDIFEFLHATYQSNGAPSTSGILELVPDVVVTDLRADASTIYVTIYNPGNCKVTTDVTVRYNHIVDPPVTLLPGASTTLYFEWSPTLGRWQITAEASPVLGETNTADNIRTITVSIGYSGGSSSSEFANGYHIISFIFALFASVMVLSFRKNREISLSDIPASILKQNLHNNLPHNPTNIWQDWTTRRLI